MACCLTAPSHYLNQCWLIITKVQWCLSEGNFAWDITAISVTKINLKIIFLRFHWNLPGSNELTIWKTLIVCPLDYCNQFWSPSKKGDIQSLELAPTKELNTSEMPLDAQLRPSSGNLLDRYLITVPDEPIIPGLTKYRWCESNSIMDWTRHAAQHVEPMLDDECHEHARLGCSDRTPWGP